MRADLKRLKRSLDSSRTSTVPETAPSESSTTLTSSSTSVVPVERGKSEFSRDLVAFGMLLALAAGLYGGKMFFSTTPPPPPTYRQLTFRRGSIRSARFAPDGQTILYSAAWQGSPVDVFTASWLFEVRRGRQAGPNWFGVTCTSEMAVLFNGLVVW